MSMKIRYALIILLTICGLLSIQRSTPALADDDVGWILGQINSLRAAHGIRPLTLNPQLMSSATGHSQYLANNPYSNPHIEANGSTPRSRIAAAGYPGSVTGENVYGGGLATAAIAYNWWVGSPVHYAGMVNADFSEVGIGIGSGPYGHFFTTDFGDRGAPQPTQNPANPPAGPPSANSGGAPPAQAPRPTHRPYTPVPTDTPAPSATPSDTFTPLPTHTSEPSGTPISATETPIEIEVVPQGAVALLPSSTIMAADVPTTASFNPTTAPPTVTPIAIAAVQSVGTAAPSNALISVASGSIDNAAAVDKRVAAPADSGNPLRTIIPFALALQVIVLGGLIVKGKRRV